MSDIAAIEQLLQHYFDGLYQGNVATLQQVFHPAAVYATVSSGELLQLDMPRYWQVVSTRLAPAVQGQAREDQIESISFAGSDTALARVRCRIGQRRFIDLLSLVYLQGEWRIISKVFHYDES